MSTTEIAKDEVGSTTKSGAASTEAVHFGTKVRLGSRKIKLKQIKQFSMLPKEAKQIRDEVIKKVGSQWKDGTRDIIRGLSPEEEVAYLPKILGLKPEHDDWETRVKEFWADFSIAVPAREEIEIEAGFKLKRNSTSEAEPIDVLGYMQYNFCKANSKVAAEHEDNPSLYTFKLIDTAANLVEQEAIFSLRKEVDMAFYRLTRSIDQQERLKIDWILETRGGEKGLGMNILNMTNIQKEMELEKIKNKDPEGFKTLLDDKRLETKALVRKAITYRLMENDNGVHIYNGNVIGNTLENAIAWIDDPNNSTSKIALVEKIKSYLQ